MLKIGFKFKVNISLISCLTFQVLSKLTKDFILVMKRKEKVFKGVFKHNESQKVHKGK